MIFSFRVICNNSRPDFCQEKIILMPEWIPCQTSVKSEGGLRRYFTNLALSMQLE